MPYMPPPVPCPAADCNMKQKTREWGLGIAGAVITTVLMCLAFLFCRWVMYQYVLCTLPHGKLEYD